MTEFLRPGPLGTTEHDTAGEFSKIRLNRPSHSFIGKGQAPVLLGAASYDDESKRMLQRNPAPGSRSIEADVKAIVASYEQSVAHMVATKRRLPGSGSLTGWANNVKRELQFHLPAKESQSKDNPPMFDCADQAAEVLNNLNKLGLAKRWKLHLIGSPPHYKAQAVPIDSVSPLITMASVLTDPFQPTPAVQRDGKVGAGWVRCQAFWRKRSSVHQAFMRVVGLKIG